VLKSINRIFIIILADFLKFKKFCVLNEMPEMVTNVLETVQVWIPSITDNFALLLVVVFAVAAVNSSLYFRISYCMQFLLSFVDSIFELASGHFSQYQALTKTFLVQ